MKFDSFADFLAMDGHGLYVWLCYGTGLIVFLILSIGPRLRYRKVMAELQQRENRSQVSQNTGFQVDSID